MSDLRRSVHPSHGPYAEGLDRNEANFAPLTPLSFLLRTAAIYPDRIAALHGQGFAFHIFSNNKERTSTAGNAFKHGFDIGHVGIKRIHLLRGNVS